ncbi:MAG: formate dehydrogenase accessory sulfurtransferase FdhD [Actinomycetia bacterium]|nr:formate dehydrogenase accessory sulfurtransferase FdhD [Actinomycetes bacterium]
MGRRIKIEKVRSDGSMNGKQDMIPREILLHLILNSEKISVISCSPGDLIELASGYTVSNGYIDNYNKIDLIEFCNENEKFEDFNKDSGPVPENTIVKIRTHADSGKSRMPAGPGGIRYMPSGCGSIDNAAIAVMPPSIKSGKEVNADIILELNNKNLSEQKYKNAFGGLHSASLFDRSGKMILVMEDIGRHNCLDKVFGHIFIRELDPSDKIIFTSGRISLDLVFKVSRVSIPIVVTNSSVTYSAAVLAGKIGLTIIGYARGNRFNIYSCPERIIKNRARKA